MSIAPDDANSDAANSSPRNWSCGTKSQLELRNGTEPLLWIAANWSQAAFQPAACSWNLSSKMDWSTSMPPNPDDSSRAESTEPQSNTAGIWPTSGNPAAMKDGHRHSETDFRKKDDTKTISFSEDFPDESRFQAYFLIECAHQ